MKSNNTEHIQQQMSLMVWKYNKLEDKSSNTTQRESNPYETHFWKWWPDLYRDLHTFRITGGEPMLAQDTWKVLDYIIDEPNPNRNLNLSINSNLGLEDNMIDKLIGKINRIEDEDRVNEFIIFLHQLILGVNKLNIFVMV